MRRWVGLSWFARAIARIRERFAPTKRVAEPAPKLPAPAPLCELPSERTTMHDVRALQVRDSWIEIVVEAPTPHATASATRRMRALDLERFEPDTSSRASTTRVRLEWMEAYARRVSGARERPEDGDETAPPRAVVSRRRG